MIVTMRSIQEKGGGHGRWMERESFRRWCLAFGLEALLVLLLLLLAGQAVFLPSAPVMSPEAEAGTGDDLSVVLLMASGQPLRPARFAPAASSPAVTAVTKPVKATAVSAPVVPTTRAVEPVSTAAPAAVTPLVREASPAATVAEPVAAPNAAPALAATDAGGTGSNAGQTSTTGAAGNSGQPNINADATGSSQGSGSGVGSRHARHPYFSKLKTWLNAHKTYPAALKKAKTQGTVVLTFTISRRGELLSSRIVTGSGEPLLDQAALEMLQRSSPMPPLPDDLGLDQLTLTIPVEYSLITR